MIIKSGSNKLKVAGQPISFKKHQSEDISEEETSEIENEINYMSNEKFSFIDFLKNSIIFNGKLIY